MFEALCRQAVPGEGFFKNVGPHIVAMDRVIARCEESYGSRVKVLDHPVLGTLTATQWRKFDLAHGRYHVKQILELKTSI
jgi:hypothetical protein